MGNVINFLNRSLDRRSTVHEIHSVAGAARAATRARVFRPPGPSFEPLLERLALLISRATRVDTRCFESRAAEEIRGELIPELEGVLEQAMGTLEAVCEHYEARDEAGAIAPGAVKGGDFNSVVDELMRTLSSAERIADVAMIARMELSHRRARLRRLSERAGTWELIEVAASVRRRILKSATATQRAVCEHEGARCQNTWFRTELERSLLVRRVYAAFRRRLELERPPARQQVYDRLRLVGTSLAILIGHDAYEHLRVSDRQMIRALQARVIAWLRGDASKGARGTARAGERIWQDVAASANLLMQVNNRAELREHDLAVLTEVCERLPALACSNAVPPSELLAPLEALAGRDPQLERMLLAARSGAAERAAGWRALIGRLRSALEGGRAPAPSW